MSDIFLILHNIRSTHNVGSIFRTADGAGVKKIYLTGYTPEPFDVFGKLRKDFAKASLGSEQFVLWEKTKNINQLLKKLKKEKVFIASLEQSKNSIPLNRFFATGKFSKNKPPVETTPLLSKEGRGVVGLALILGNEVRGVPKSVLLKSDAVLEIPMMGKKESLNVSVAAGIVLYFLALC